eukprot:TRINITY_DN16304_c0_g1_i1.p1 TRINITY_DN16304_c0_g1~~TRINITY_DN16304_c0_g1_i1.p1  ORF type:complete len:299 (+),score=30.56 TRINITY_DN16304_c0_g1_i1:17-913(+)
MAYHLSLAEQRYIAEGLDLNVRADGRGCLDYRYMHIETGITVQTNGSARLRLGDTDVMVGVKVDLGEPSTDAPNKGRLECAIECSPSVSVDLDSRDAEKLSDELTRAFTRSHTHAPAHASTSALDFETLCLVPSKLCWVIYIDVMVLDTGGNLYDAISLAIRAALFNTRLPKITVGEEDDIEVSDDPQESTPLDISNVPIFVTLTRIGSRFVVDATIEEEQCEVVRALIAVNKKGNICSTQMSGRGGGIDPTALHEMMRAAQRIGAQLISEQDGILGKEERRNATKSETTTSRTFLGF